MYVGNKPEITFGSNVAVWHNKTGRTIQITPRRYKDPETSEWKNATGWNVSDVAHLVLCLQRATNYCLDRRADEEAGEKYQPPTKRQPDAEDASSPY